MALVPLPNQPGANNFFRTADLLDNSDRCSAACDWQPERQGQHLRPLHLLEPHAPDSRRVRRRHRRHRHVGVRQPDHQDQRDRRRLDPRSSARRWSTSSASRGRSRRRTPCTRRSGWRRPPPRRSPARSPIRRSPADSPGSRSTALLRRLGSRPHRIARLPAEVPAHQPVRVHRHAVVAEAATTRSSSAATSSRRWRTSTWTSRRRAARCGSGTRFTGNPMADYLLGYVTDLQLSNVWVVEQRHWATMFFVQDDWKVNSKLSLNLGLRYDFITPALEAHQRADQLRSERRRQPAVRQRRLAARTAGWSSPTRNNFAPRVGVGLQARREDADPRRLGHLLQPVRSRRQRGSAGAEPARPGQQDHHPDVGLAGVLPAAGLSGRTSWQSAEPRSQRPDSSKRSGCARSRTTRRRRPSIRPASGCSASSLTGMVLSADFIYTRGSQPGVAGQPESAAAERRRQQRARRACRTRTSASSSGARRTASRTTRASTSAWRSASPGATRSASSYTIGDSKDNTSEQLTTQGSNAFPAELARLQPVVRTERLRRAPPLDDQLRGRPAAWPERLRAATGWRPASARGARAVPSP